MSDYRRVLHTFLCPQHHVDPALGVYVIDRYTYHALDFLEQVHPGSTKTMGQFVSPSPLSVPLQDVFVFVWWWCWFVMMLVLVLLLFLFSVLL